MGLFNKKNKDTTSSSDGNSFLKISVTKDGSEYTFLPEGRLDTITSPDLESKINEVIGNATKLTIDFAKLEYISSAGLRVLLGALQDMEGKGEMVVRNLTRSVRDVFILTGFNRLLNVE
ncbi:MAG: STAS domain-containing protein [Ruminococcus sp.]|nr:STAS domain-containing protein [Ruminococcus sp.]